MESTKTYTNRTNARRAGVAAGVPSELVEITVHKDRDQVRFGWKATEAPAPAAPEVTTVVEKTAVPKPKKQPKPKVEQETRNGVKRPKVGGLCRAVWDWLDVNPSATVRDAKAVAADHMWNEGNVTCEFYNWRKFHGISGRVKAA